MFEPGKGFYYSNTGCYLLGMLVEQRSGKSFATYLADMVEPHGLTQRSFCTTGATIKGMAAGYDRQGTTLVNTSAVNMDIPFAAGSMWSTARDMVICSHAIVEQEEHLTLVLPAGTQTMVLQREARGVFTVKGQPAARVLFDMTGDTVTGIVLDRGMRPLKGTKQPWRVQQT